LTQTPNDILRQCALFQHVSSERRAGLARICIQRSYEKGTWIFRQGDDCPGVFIVQSGTVRIFNIGSTGKEHVLHMVGPNQTFAEVAAIGGFPCPAHAQAVAPTRCVLLPLDPFVRQMQSDHQLCLEMMTGFAQWVRRLIGLLEDLVLRDALGRTARYLLEAETGEDGMVRLPSLKRYVASHLNLTSETLSRTLGRLIEAGLVVEHENQRVELRDPAALRAISQGDWSKF
jgi:CRP/FNR family transcriptional regulator